MDLNFECTRCGKCCHDLRLSLTVQEANAWLARGDEIQVLCEAIPWPSEPSANDRQAHDKRRRSFPAFSGSMPIRVIVTLAASFEGACPNLMSDLRCAIYDSRPAVCRIYPAEINPLVALQPTAKECPPEAWAADRPKFVRAGVLVDAATRSVTHQRRVQSEADVGAKERLCTLLGIHAAAMANDGYVVHSPDRDALARAVAAIVSGEIDPSPLSRGSQGLQGSQGWLFVSDVGPTVQALVDEGAHAIVSADAGHLSFDFLSTNPGAE